MEAKQKAKELVKKFDRAYNKEAAKQNALIAVEEILKETRQWSGSFMGKERLKFWEEVKLEIEYREK